MLTLSCYGKGRIEMNKMKKLICTVLCAVCLAGILPAAAQAESTAPDLSAYTNSMEAAKNAYSQSLEQAKDASWTEYNKAVDQAWDQYNELLNEIERQRQELIAAYMKRREEVIRFIYNSLNEWVDEMNARLDYLEVDKQYRFTRYKEADFGLPVK